MRLLWNPDASTGLSPPVSLPHASLQILLYIQQAHTVVQCIFISDYVGSVEKEAHTDSRQISHCWLGQHHSYP